MAETRPLERLTASDLFSQAPQSVIRRGAVRTTV